MDLRFFALSRWLLLSAAARGAAGQQLLRELGTKWEPPVLATAPPGSALLTSSPGDLRNCDNDLVAGIGMHG
jgi:hypothetical protein